LFLAGMIEVKAWAAVELAPEQDDPAVLAPGAGAAPSRLNQGNLPSPQEYSLPVTRIQALSSFSTSPEPTSRDAPATTESRPVSPADPGESETATAALRNGMPAGLARALQTLETRPSPEPASNPARADSTPEQARDSAPARPRREASTTKAVKAVHQPQSEQPAARRSSGPAADDEVEKASCSTCGGFHSSSAASIFHNSMGCADGQCVPGQAPCYPPANECDTIAGAFLSNLYQILNCNDPCYEPRWDPAAYASVFADYARPRTVTRIRYDDLINLRFPDRNQYFLMQTNTNFPQHFTNKHGVTYRTDPSANLQQLYLYQEAAAGRGSFFVEYPYRQLNPLFSPTQAGFSDLNFGIKSMWLDTELLQVTFQFRTYTPSGNAAQGLGTGHFSLDPSVLASMKLAPDTYYQAQLGNWIPLGGNQKIAGGIFYWLMSLNQVIYRFSPDTPVIAMLEMDGWSFENGGYTNPIVNAASKIIGAGGGVSYFNIGPGLRTALGNRVDLGTALTWSTTPNHWGSPWFRLEVRFLF
jgi:hypothetical protein